MSMKLYDHYLEHHSNKKLSCWPKLDLAVKNCRTVLAFGPPGTGKTQFLLGAANHFTQGRAEQVTLDADSSRWSLVYQQLPPDFRLSPGPGLRSWRDGVLVINELDRVGEGSAETALHWLLDAAHIATLTLDDGTIVRPHDGFRCFASMNGAPHELPEALLDRFEAVVLVDKPHPGIVEAINHNQAIANLASAMFADASKNWVLSPRQLLQVNRLLKLGLSVEEAFAVVVPHTSHRKDALSAYAAHEASVAAEAEMARRAARAPKGGAR